MEKIGNTPLIRLNNIEKYFNLNVRLYGKVESFNLTGSIKDRAAYQIIKDYLDDGLINDDTLIIEATSGNTGISLAAIGQMLNKKVCIIMPSSMSKQRQEMIKQYGATLILNEGGMKQSHDLAIKMHEENKNSIIAGQFENYSNIKAHLLTTGPEIKSQCPNVKYIFAGFGTGGTASGLAMYFKGQVDVIAIEPAQSPLYTKGYAAPHLIQGIGANFKPLNFKDDLIKQIITADDKKAIEYAKLIHKLENLFVGYSSGAALLGAIDYIKKHNLNDVDIVIIFPDKGDRYSWN